MALTTLWGHSHTVYSEVGDILWPTLWSVVFHFLEAEEVKPRRYVWCWCVSSCMSCWLQYSCHCSRGPKARFSHDPSFFFSFLLSATHMLSSLPSAVTADLNNKSLLKYFVYQNLKKTEVLKNPEGKSAMCSSRSSMYDCVSETTETHQMSHWHWCINTPEVSDT